jgi:hypothetical protein
LKTSSQKESDGGIFVANRAVWASEKDILRDAGREQGDAEK